MHMLTPPADPPSRALEDERVGQGVSEAAAVVSPEERVARLREKIIETALPVVAAQHCELVSLEFRREPIGWVLRLFIEKLGHDPRKAIGGVTLAECTKVSRDLGMALEVSELIDHAYNLEVSSPGLERPLVKTADYARFLGMRAKLQLSTPIEAHPNRKVYRGEIVALRDPEAASGEKGSQIVLREDDLGDVTLPFDLVAKANLVVDFKPTPKPGKPGKGKGKTKHKGAPRDREATGTVKQHDASGEKTGRQGE
jgi:ribosome maturation factor RimP